MNQRRSIWIIAILALGIGLAGGYLMFADRHPHAETQEEEAEAPEIYTCSMHPQIRQEGPGKCPICGMDLIPLGTSSEAGDRALEMTPEAVKLAGIRTLTVGKTGTSDGAIHLLTGKIQADERRTASQVAHVAGRIEQLYVTFTGEAVGAGQKLATIYSPELVTAQHELIEAFAMRETRPQLLAAARKKLQYWKIPDETIARIESSGVVESNITVYAEHSGIVMERDVSVGDYVSEGEPLFEIVNLNKLWVLLDAYEDDLAVIQVGDQMKFTVNTLPGEEFSARVAFIDPVINPRTRVASVRAEVANTRGLLKPEMLVRGAIVSKGKAPASAIHIPRTAVLWTGRRSVVYVRDTLAVIPAFIYREVTIEETGGDDYVVLEGLSPGEEVVVNGAFVIDAAAQLNHLPSMMNRTVRVAGMQESGSMGAVQNVPQEFRTRMSRVIDSYLELKDALVGSDAVAAGQAAKAVQTDLGHVPMSLLHGPQHDFWMKQEQVIAGHATTITSASGIEEQRKAFSFLTESLIKIIRVFGIGKDTLYIQRCPMAFDNTGGEWISDQQVIRNPYFGDRMLTCGSVIDTILAEDLDLLPATEQKLHHH